MKLGSWVAWKPGREGSANNSIKLLTSSSLRNNNNDEGRRQTAATETEAFPQTAVSSESQSQIQSQSRLMQIPLFGITTNPKYQVKIDRDKALW